MNMYEHVYVVQHSYLIYSCMLMYTLYLPHCNIIPIDRGTTVGFFQKSLRALPSSVPACIQGPQSNLSRVSHQRLNNACNL